MKLLVLTNNPERASFRQRVGVYVDYFERNGISCEIATLARGRRRRRILRGAAAFDGVFLHKKGLNPFDARRLRRHARKIIYNFDDAVYCSPARPEQYSRAHAVPFCRSVSIADMIICGSEYLAQRARPYNANVKVLPLGLDTAAYDCAAPREEGGPVRLVWIGSRSTLGYLEEIRDVIEEIAARTDNVRMRIICDEFTRFDGMAVEERPWTRETRGADLASCDIGLAPLPDQPFTRGKCSFKVLEYSASGLAVVASPVGTNADHVREGVTGYLAADRSAWVDRCMQLITDPALRRDMGREGRALAAEHDIERVGARFAALLRECLA